MRRASTLLVIAIVTIMLATHFIEIIRVGALLDRERHPPGAEAAMNSSINSYSTLGASGIVPDQMEGIAGIETMISMLMFGWSTAVLASVVQRSATRPRKPDLLMTPTDSTLVRYRTQIDTAVEDGAAR